LPDPIDPKSVDKRTAERYIRQGLLDEKAWEKHNKGLPDSTEKSAPVETTMLESQVDDDEDDEK
jgi:hypothetical protein